MEQAKGKIPGWGKRGAAHSNTPEKGNGSIDSLLGYRGDTEGKEKGTKETEDVTWGPRDPQVLLKYERPRESPIRGRSLMGSIDSTERGASVEFLIARAASTAPRLSHASKQANSKTYESRRVLQACAAFSVRFHISRWAGSQNLPQSVAKPQDRGFLPWMPVTQWPSLDIHLRTNKSSCCLRLAIAPRRLT